MPLYKPHHTYLSSLLNPLLTSAPDDAPADHDSNVNKVLAISRPNVGIDIPLMPVAWDFPTVSHVEGA